MMLYRMRRIQIRCDAHKNRSLQLGQKAKPETNLPITRNRERERERERERKSERVNNYREKQKLYLVPHNHFECVGVQ